MWVQRLKQIVSVRWRQYDLPGGSVGKEFVRLLSVEIDKLCNGEEKSEWVIVCCEWFFSVIVWLGKGKIFVVC